MTISYNWLLDYMPEKIAIDKLSSILTAVGLEVESVTPYESIPGSLQGLVVGQVLTCSKHPNADKLSVTTVSIGAKETLQVVCGAPNVAQGLKVIVAPIGTTIYPIQGEPITMKKAKIRGEESQGMLCAQDEVGIGNGHDGIAILPQDAVIGSDVAQLYSVYTDYIIEIGLTPNHMDAQSHLGVARDIVAYMNHHEKCNWQLKTPLNKQIKLPAMPCPITVQVHSNTQCLRYTGIVINNVMVAESPIWLQQRLRAIGLKPINNVVDVTNYILHETGQPLHAFDMQAISSNAVQVQCLPAGTSFTTLDGTVRTLTATDVMVCNGTEPMCIGGVYGGLHSGVGEGTQHIFLESALFHPQNIRTTSLHHGLRTDAAVRYEKGVDISNTLNVLKRAAIMIAELAQGTLLSDVVDVYPEPKEKLQVGLKYHYLKKLSGKNYHPETIKNILQYLGFEIAKDGIDELTVLVPHHKTDITIPADLVEEIMRIDGLDNIDIPKAILITPAADVQGEAEKWKEKIATTLVAIGMQEIFTNSITNSKYTTAAHIPHTVAMLNSLSSELNVLRTTMLETGLQAIAHNLNRKQLDLLLFEYGRTYHTYAAQQYTEVQHLAIYITGMQHQATWQAKPLVADLYYAKMVTEKILHTMGIKFEAEAVVHTVTYTAHNEVLATVCQVTKAELAAFGIKQGVYYINVLWNNVLNAIPKQRLTYTEISKYPTVSRDMAFVISKSIPYASVEKSIYVLGIKKLTSIQLFDIFTNDKLGNNKQSIAINVQFADSEKTLTDKEVDAWMLKITNQLTTELEVSIRK